MQGGDHSMMMKGAVETLWWKGCQGPWAAQSQRAPHPWPSSCKGRCAWWRTDLLISYILAILIYWYLISWLYWYANIWIQSYSSMLIDIPGGGDVLGCVLSLAVKILHSVYLTRGRWGGGWRMTKFISYCSTVHVSTIQSIHQGLFCHDQVSSGKFLAFFNLWRNLNMFLDIMEPRTENKKSSLEKLFW